MDTNKEFTECYNIWLKRKGIKHSLYNFQRYCQVWNENINVATKKAIIEFRNNLTKENKK